MENACKRGGQGGLGEPRVEAAKLEIRRTLGERGISVALIETYRLDASLTPHATLLHGSTAGRSQPPAATFYVRRTYTGRPSSIIWFSEATAMATSVVCRPSVRERSASPITRL
jgi:hypothetical protein